MRMTITRSDDLEVMVARDIRAAERSSSRAMRWAAAEIKKTWRADIAEAGLGKKLGNTVRAEAYPGSAESMDAAALIWTKAPRILSSHEDGALIRSADGFWLAIPLPSAGRARFGRKMTPGDWEKRTGKRLRYVYRKGRSALLVADDARISAKGKALGKGGRRRKDGILTGAQTVPIFVLVRQVKLPKRTNLIGEAQRLADMVPGMIGID